MPSRNTLIWIGAAAVVVVAAGAGAVVWTHPDFLEQNPADIPIVARAPVEPKTPTVPPPVPAAPPASAPAPADKTPAQTAALEPAFDVVNVDPSGEAVIAGRAAPNEKVELRDGGKTVAEATADAAGQFVIIPPALAPGDHSLSLAANDKGQPAISSPVIVSVPVQEAKAAVAPGPPEAKSATAAAAPTNPNSEPSALGMRTLATPASASGARVAIQSVEADAAGGLVAKGSAEPNAALRLYLNQAGIAEAKTQSDGRWSLTIKGGMTPGGYVMQADEINPSGATVLASANTPFEYPDIPAPPAQAATAPASPVQSSAPSPANPVVESVQTKRVATGHTLWALSKSYYGDPTHYPVIYEANRAQIHNPNVIYPGQVFVVPKPDAKP
ncbi:MAG: LysM peptidoglycan-binding domain-containing protein [Hyphomicrobiales bacterium]|nr:LysM peptidoglycan-binding domain-containing protein [Hyphomicrobiales bacterium]